MVPAPDGRTLEVGCGEGRVTRDLQQLGHDVYAIDAAPSLVTAAADADPSGRYALADAASLPFADAGFGLVVAYNSLMDMDDMAASVREAARVLRPGGRVLVIDMLEHDRREYQQEMGHVWLGFDRSQIAGWLEAAGFAHVRVQPLPPAPRASGPALFAATGRRPEHHQPKEAP